MRAAPARRDGRRPIGGGNGAVGATSSSASTRPIASDSDTEAWPVVLSPGSHYLLAFGGSRVVVGATRETGTGFDYRVTAAGQAEVLNQALTIAPGLGPAIPVETRIGFRPVGRASNRCWVGS